MNPFGELDLAVLVPAVAFGAGAMTTRRRWRAGKRRRQTHVWVESIGRAVTEERLRSLVEHGI